MSSTRHEIAKRTPSPAASLVAPAWTVNALVGKNAEGVPCIIYCIQHGTLKFTKRETAYIRSLHGNPLRVPSLSAMDTMTAAALGEIKERIDATGYRGPAHESVAYTKTTERFLHMTIPAETVTTTNDETFMFQRHDYVRYAGTVSSWKGLYIVHVADSDGYVNLRDYAGGRVTGCPVKDLRLLYRPTKEELA